MGARWPPTDMSAVLLAEYDPGWPAQFEALQSAIRRVLPTARVEHIGSTSVPGCAAKPVIDISVGLVPGSSARVAELRSAGLVFRSIRPYSVVFAVSAPDGSRRANVHVRYRDTEAELRDLRFRDYLRSHPETAQSYVEVKRRAALATQDGVDYTQAKSPFIEGLQPEVLRWSEQTQWSPG